MIYGLSALLILMADFHSSFRGLTHHARSSKNLVPNWEELAVFQSDSQSERGRIEGLGAIMTPRLVVTEVVLVITIEIDTKVRLETASFDSCKK